MGQEVVGECLEDETTAENGDRRQRTTNGELVWRQSDGRGVFTNGYETWLNGPDGLASRLNTDRFPWEGDDLQVAAQPNPAQTATFRPPVVSVASSPATAPAASASATPTTVPPAAPQQPVVADLPVTNPPDIGGGLRLGGFSGLVPLDRTGTMFMTVTDRGPNKDARVNGDKVATFLEPTYSPSLVKLRRDQDGVQVVDRIPLRLGRGTDPVTGGPGISGLPNTSNQEPAYDADARRRLGVDPNGVDTEGIALDPRDGSYWLCEEYGPSILHVAADGTILTRLVPKGLDLKGAGYDVKQVLPSVLLKRDSGSTAAHRKIYQIDLGAATDIKDMTFSRKPLEQMSDAEIDKAKVTPVAKRMVIDLVAMGFRHELVEGLALVDDSTIAVVNDNNFEASEPSELMLIRLPAPVR